MKTYFLPLLLTNFVAIAAFVIYDIAGFITEKAVSGNKGLDGREPRP